ncbi:NEK protein kinase [Thecamonas trahens ATCC 50062]|uniref:non-specific serine/threonine protein kinase n=1 Tax=Thecamonas trahens ATCC 50062 TaxID=461836 RepID=A0A0L0D6B8_THETB|nr:NEK protein kinase [Thecamonas trahens ATCC 50062]KNC47932.1 NEK protein kinase [Thecamonas trahens ATCC 50062]|eukprot:XP_013758951.1 NEK protein kinase [Thecamonas trahens ATCC 50062]
MAPLSKRSATHDDLTSPGGGAVDLSSFMRGELLRAGILETGSRGHRGPSNSSERSSRTNSTERSWSHPSSVDRDPTRSKVRVKVKDKDKDKRKDKAKAKRKDKVKDKAKRKDKVKDKAKARAKDKDKDKARSKYREKDRARGKDKARDPGRETEPDRPRRRIKVKGTKSSSDMVSHEVSLQQASIARTDIGSSVGLSKYSSGDRSSCGALSRATSRGSVASASTEPDSPSVVCSPFPDVNIVGASTPTLNPDPVTPVERANTHDGLGADWEAAVRAAAASGAEDNSTLEPKSLRDSMTKSKSWSSGLEPGKGSHSEARVDEYLVLEPLASGTSGSVYLTRHRQTGKMVVMKKINMSSFTAKDALCAALEVQALGELTHPHIVKHYESFVHDKVLHIVMEHVELGDLDSRIKEQRATQMYFSERTVLTWFAQLVAALDYCHANKYLHRDIKAPNVMIAADNTLRLADFGLSAELETESSMRQTRVGTPYYMSPELCQGLSYTQKNDIWGLGTLLFRMCALTYPFKAADLQSLLETIVDRRTPDIPECYSVELSDLVQAMLAKDPNERPTASEILRLDFLQPYLDPVRQREEAHWASSFNASITVPASTPPATVANALLRLADEDTAETAAAQLAALATDPGLTSTRAGLLLGMLAARMDATMARKQALVVVEGLAEAHPSFARTLASKVMAVLVARIQEGDAQLAEAIAATVSILGEYAVVPLDSSAPETSGIAPYLAPLLSQLVTLNVSVHRGAGAAIAALIGSVSAAVLKAEMPKIGLKVLDLISSTASLLAVEPLFEAAGKLVDVLGDALIPWIPAYLTALVNALALDEWQARRAAAGALIVFALRMGPALSVIAPDMIVHLERHKFDKFRKVRELVGVALALFRDLPGPDGMPPEPVDPDALLGGTEWTVGLGARHVHPYWATRAPLGSSASLPGHVSMSASFANTSLRRFQTPGKRTPAASRSVHRVGRVARTPLADPLFKPLSPVPSAPPQVSRTGVDLSLLARDSDSVAPHPDLNLSQAVLDRLEEQQAAQAELSRQVQALLNLQVAQEKRYASQAEEMQSLRESTAALETSMHHGSRPVSRARHSPKATAVHGRGRSRSSSRIPAPRSRAPPLSSPSSRSPTPSSPPASILSEPIASPVSERLPTPPEPEPEPEPLLHLPSSRPGGWAPEAVTSALGAVVDSLTTSMETLERQSQEALDLLGSRVESAAKAVEQVAGELARAALARAAEERAAAAAAVGSAPPARGPSEAAMAAAAETAPSVVQNAHTALAAGHVDRALSLLLEGGAAHTTQLFHMLADIGPVVRDVRPHTLEGVLTALVEDMVHSPDHVPLGLDWLAAAADASLDLYPALVSRACDVLETLASEPTPQGTRAARLFGLLITMLMDD